MENPLKKRYPHGKGSSRREIVKLLEIAKAYVRSVGVHEEDVLKDVSLDYSDSVQIKTALMQAEREKAKGIMEIQRQRMRMF